MSKKLFGRAVSVKENENVNQALRRFKKKVEESGVLDDLREREHYIKPTTRRKKAASAAKARWMKKIRENELPKKLF